MKYYLYQLEVIPKQAFYIGITHNPTQRMVAHLASRKRRTLKERFIDDMRQAGVPVQMKVLAIFDDKSNLMEFEKEVDFVTTLSEEWVIKVCG